MPRWPQHHRGRAVGALVRLEAEVLVGVDRVEAAVLELVGAQLVDQADAAPFVRQVEEHAVAGGAHHGERFLQLRAAVAAQRAQQIAGEALGMQTAQRRLVGGGIADHDRELLGAAVGRAEPDDPRVLGRAQRHARLAHGLQRQRRRGADSR